MRRATTAAVAAVLACGTALAGCSGGSDRTQGSGAPRTPASRPTGTAQAATPAVVAKVTGRLPAQRRDRVAQQVGAVVDGWLDHAYLGDFPRSDYAAAFTGFTAGAAAKAQHELALMTNAAISGRIDQATATKRSVALDVLAVGQRPVGVTATVDLAFRTTGAAAGTQQVTGTLDLTPDGDGWKIFGYRISRTPATATSGSAS